MATPTIDLTRLVRALELKASKLKDGSYRVTGGAEPHRVRLDAGECDCIDRRFGRKRGRWCKHLWRALLAERGTEVQSEGLTFRLR